MIKPNVVIYSRAGCHLCDQAKEVLHRLRVEQPFILEEIDIETDPELMARYKDDIPVITINGIEAFRHRVTPQGLRDKLLGI